MIAHSLCPLCPEIIESRKETTAVRKEERGKRKEKIAVRKEERGQRDKVPSRAQSCPWSPGSQCASIPVFQYSSIPSVCTSTGRNPPYCRGVWQTELNLALNYSPGQVRINACTGTCPNRDCLYVVLVPATCLNFSHSLDFCLAANNNGAPNLAHFPVS